MSQVVVYRVQDRSGRGPWKPGFSCVWVEDRADAEYKALKPWPEEFGPVHRKAIYGMHLGCGCLSVEQLRRWFTEKEYSTLRAFGYQAVQMTVGRILAKSDVQCVFERSFPLASGVEPIELYPAVDAVARGGRIAELQAAHAREKETSS